MRILLTTLGTRGDAEPFLTLGYFLRQAGHSVHIALPAQLSHLAAETGLEYTAFDPSFLRLIEGQAGRDIMGGKGNFLARMRNLARLFRSSQQVQRLAIREQCKVVREFEPERIVTHPKCLFIRAHGALHPEKVIVASPVPNAQHPSSLHPQIGIPTSLGAVGNRWSYGLTNWGTTWMAKKFLGSLSTNPPETRLSRYQLQEHFLQREPWLYLVSPSVFERPPEWPTQAQIVGYYERPKTLNWQPPEEVQAFLNRYGPEGITLITFGSMVNADPERTSQAIIEVLRRHRIPAILVTSSGGLDVGKAALPDHVLAVDRIPYDWAFPRVHSIVHHGGSGTTHTALRYGRSSAIVPHIIDQFFWNRQIARLGAGPRGIPVRKLNSHNFADLLLKLREERDYAHRAQQIARQMETEDRIENLLQLITEGFSVHG